MHKTIQNISDPEDVNISIWHYLRSDSPPDVVIQHIRAGKNVSIRIEEFFHQSPDYRTILNHITGLKNILANRSFHTDTERIEHEKKLAALEALKDTFRIDVMSLGKLLVRYGDNSERLRQASTLFEKGHFQEANTLLDAKALLHDQETLLILADHWESMQKILLGPPNTEL